MRVRDFRLAEWLVRTQTCELIGPETSRRLRPRTISVLLHLAQHAGEVRSREDVLAEVWDDAFVGEEVLSHCIWELRRALGDDSREPRFIQTIHRKGYRLIAPVIWLEAESIIADSSMGPACRNDKGLNLLAERVQQFWIDQALNDSLGGASPYRLNFESRPEAIEHPWGRLRPPVEAMPELLRLDEPLVTFRRLGGALLILGEGGSGKTVTLLRLAQQASELARKDPVKPVPVVLQLASWTDRTPLLESWLEEEISRHYYVPRSAAQTWIRDGVLMVLLDGLDEVEGAQRRRCVEAINRFHEAVPSVSLVVTCRTEVYQNLAREDTRLTLSSCLAAVPLTEAQVTEVLNETPDLKDCVMQDPTLRELAASPLMLSILVRFDLGESLSGDRLQGANRDSLLFRYIHGCLRAKGKAYPPYSERQTVNWLAALAKSMLRHHRTLFQLEEIQPSWLRTTWRRWAYVLLTRIGVSLFLALAFALIVRVARGPGAQPVILWCAAAGGLPVALLDLALFNRRRPRSESGAVGYPLLVAVVAATAMIGIQMLLLPTKTLAGPMLFALCLATVFRRPLEKVRWTTDVAAVETFRWSWRGCLRGLMLGALGAWLLTIIIGLARGHLVHPVDVFSTVPNGVIGGLIAAHLLGLRPGLLDVKTRPNHGMWLTARNAALGAVLLAAGTLLTLLLARLLVNQNLLGPMRVFNEVGLQRGPILLFGFGIGMAIIGAIGLGGVELIKHYVLRWLLWTEGTVPARFPQFLAYAAHCRLLQRAGGGYIFMHRSLQEYLASLGSESTR